MRTLHIAPSDSAGGSLRQAIQTAGSDNEVLRFLDDLSCGPIAAGDPAERAAWWRQYYEDRDSEALFTAFWDRVSTSDERLVVWFGRHRSSELAFLLAWTDRLRDRPFHYIDVTGRRFLRRNSPTELGPPMQSVGIMNPDMLRSLLGSERAASAEFKEEAVRAWRRLKAENAPFRIVTAAGMVSAPIDCFDALLLERATSEWKSAVRIIAETIGCNVEPYLQVGDVMLQARIAALIDGGKLLADGDPWDRRACRVRLPG
jgi:hypothetical protein